MKHSLFCSALIILSSSACLPAQSSNGVAQRSPIDQYAVTAGSTRVWVPPTSTSAPFSRMAIGGGVSAMGINMQVAVIANRYMNLRGVGNFFNYTVDNISTNGFEASGKFNLATAGASVDFYPFPYHGFRISPGALFYNQNRVTATMTASAGTSFTLDDYTYYSSQASPVTGSGALGLNTSNPAFTITTGWGNMIPRRGGHFSFPFEIGAAFIGTPSVNFALNGGQVCDTNGQNCVNVATDPTVQSNLQAQIAKYKNDVNPYRYYPILSMGMSYSFGLRGGASKQAGAPQPSVRK